MPPPSKKRILNDVKEISEISNIDGGFLSNVDRIRSQNSVITSTPAPSESQINFSQNVKERFNVENETTEIYQNSNCRESDAGSSRSSTSCSKKRSLEDCFSTTAHLQGSRSLFSSGSNSSYTENIYKGSQFNLTAFTNRQSKRGSQPNIRNSPFYTGRTMYGGASSASYSSISESLSLSTQNKSPIKAAIQIQPIKLNIPDSNQCQMSQTARRILDALEQFAKPIPESPKISSPSIPTLVQNVKRFGNEERILNRTQEDANRSAVLANKPYSRLSNPSTVNRSFKRELQVATVPELLRMLNREKLQRSTQAVRKLATTSTSDLIKPNMSYKMRTDEDEKSENKSTNKVKTKVTKTRASKNYIDEEEVAPVLQLPSVPLTITNMPKFDIKLPGKPERKSTALKNVAVAEERPNNIQELSSTSTNAIKKDFSREFPSNSVTPGAFQFAPPIKITSAKYNLISCNNFKFSAPANISSHKDAVVPSSNAKKEMKVESSDVKLFSKNIKENVNFAQGITNRSFLNPPFVSNPIKVNKDKNDNNFKDIIKKQNVKWECKECLTRNEPEKNKCACCETAKPGVETAKATPLMSGSNNFSMPVSNSFQDLLNKQNQKWECKECMTRNEQNLNKCLCCETPKPGSNLNKSTEKVHTNFGASIVTPAVTNSFQDFVKKQNLKWECSGCMTRNDQNKSKCACCEAPKPGAIPEKEEFNFSSVPIMEFKFGMDKAVSETTKVGSNDSILKTSNVSTFNFTNTTANTKNTFTFGMPAQQKPAAAPAIQKDKDLLPTAIKAVATTTVSSFTFGIPTVTNSNSVHNDVKTAVTLTSQSSSASKQESPKSLFQFGASTICTPTKTVADTPFCIPSSSQSNVTNTSTVVTSQTGSATTSSIFTFGSNTPISSTFNGNSNDAKRNGSGPSELSAKLPTFSMMKPSSESPVVQSAISFKPSSKTDARSEDTMEPPSKKPVFTFGTGATTAKLFETSTKKPLELPEPKPIESKFQFGQNSTSTDQSNRFSFSYNTASKQEPSLFVFGSNGSSNNSTPSTATPFTFGSALAQPQALGGFGINKTSDTFGSNHSSNSAFAPPTSNTQQNVPAFLPTPTPAFNFGSGSTASTPTPTHFTFGNSKPSSGTTTGGFNFSSAPQGPPQIPNFGSDVNKPSTFTFNMGTTGTQPVPTARKIKKAVRRTPR